MKTLTIPPPIAPLHLSLKDVLVSVWLTTCPPNQSSVMLHDWHENVFFLLVSLNWKSRENILLCLLLVINKTIVFPSGYNLHDTKFHREITKTTFFCPFFVYKKNNHNRHELSCERALLSSSFSVRILQVFILSPS